MREVWGREALKPVSAKVMRFACPGGLSRLGTLCALQDSIKRVKSAFHKKSILKGGI